MGRGELIVILGPTASGKTELAIKVAQALNGEVISADSMQIYREMHIGTARPLPEEQGGIAHHLMGFVAPDANYSVACYQKDAHSAIQQILERGKQPILAGGTGLYLNSILYDMDFAAAKPDVALRERLAKEYENSPEQMHERLRKLDKDAAARIHLNDKKRLIRRLEILESGGTREYDFRRPQCRYHVIRIGVCKEREQLYKDIGRRVDKMFQDGLEEEARRIYSQYGSEIAAFAAIGYKEFLPYFSGSETLEETREKIKQNTRRFAKRQLTWFRREPDIHWFYRDQLEEEELVRAVLACIKEEKRRAENERICESTEK